MDKISICVPSIKTEQELQKQFNEIHQMTSSNYELIYTTQRKFAAVNRNDCLKHATSDLIIMMDDDITGLYLGWELDLLKPLLSQPDMYSIVSARLLTKKGEVSANYGMLGGDTLLPIPVQEAHSQGLNIVCSACISFIRTSIRFDEAYIGSGYEDTDFCMQHTAMFPYRSIVINNLCKLIHINEAKGQQGTKVHNRDYFNTKWNVSIG